MSADHLFSLSVTVIHHPAFNLQKRREKSRAAYLRVRRLRSRHRELLHHTLGRGRPGSKSTVKYAV